MPASTRNTPRTDPPDPQPAPPRPTAPRLRLTVVGLTAATALGFWLGFSWPAAGQAGAPAEPVASLEMVAEALDQVVTVTPEGTGEPEPITVTPEGTDDSEPVTVTPEGTDDSGPVTVTPEPTEPAEGTIAPTPTLSATPTPTPTRGMTCTPPPCPCGRYVGVCPNIVCEVCTPTPTPTAPPTSSSGSFANISTRGFVGTGDKVMIGGFIVRGAPVTMVVRALGPSMASAGVPGLCTDPTLELRRQTDGSLIASNDNWQANAPWLAQIPPGLRPSDPREAVVVATVGPGNYSGIVRCANNSTGVAMVEVFHTGGAGELANISTRDEVLTGDKVMIGGFIVRTAPMTMVVRALGPSMASAGVPGLCVDPTLELRRQTDGSLIASNDNWQVNAPWLAQIPPGLRPSDPREAVILATVGPGNYSGIVRCANNTTGIAMVEVFKLEP